MTTNGTSTRSTVSVPDSPSLTTTQLATLADVGEERTANTGDVLFQVGDDRYPFVVVLEGEVAILDAAGNEITRQGPSNFLGELNLLSGQSVFVTAVVTKPLRYIAVDREALRALLFDDGALGDLLLATFVARREALQQVAGLGLEIVGPRSSPATMRLLAFARSNRLPFTWRDPERGGDPEAAALVAGLDASSLPFVRLPGGVEMRAPSSGELSRALGIGRELEPREEVDLLVVGAGPAGLGAAVYGASEGLDTLLVESTALGGQAGESRRIENYLGFPAGITGTELTGRAVVQARKFGVAHLRVGRRRRVVARARGACDRTRQRRSSQSRARVRWHRGRRLDGGRLRAGRDARSRQGLRPEARDRRQLDAGRAR